MVSPQIKFPDDLITSSRSIKLGQLCCRDWLFSMTIWCHIAAMLKRICMQSLCKRIKLLSGVEYLLQVETPIPTQSFWRPMQYPSLNIHHHHWSLTYLEELIVFNVDTKYGCYKRMVLLNPILPALQICGRKSRDGHKQIQKNPKFRRQYTA